MRKFSVAQSYMSFTFPIATMNGTCFVREAKLSFALAEGSPIGTYINNFIIQIILLHVSRGAPLLFASYDMPRRHKTQRILHIRLNGLFPRVSYIMIPL